MTEQPIPASAPLCAAHDPNPRKPKIVLPPLACDTHAHVCGPAPRYPYWPERIYTPPDALPAQYRHMLGTLGVERAVLVQPSVYGMDNTAMLDALAADPVRLRAVAVVSPEIDFAQLEHMHALGVRGVRCNIVDVKEGKGRLPMEMLKALAAKVRPLGWHLEFLMHVDEFPDLDRLLDGFPVDVVFGHLGYMKTGLGLGAPGYQALLRLLKSGRAWVKLTGPYRISSGAMPYADVVPFAHALVEAAPDRIVWGSDWPHVTVKGAMPNDGDLCDLLSSWVPDERARHKVLVDNPAKLYGFE
jgi:predicted TIM-barrel fold metal-dependent hydrolase